MVGREKRCCVWPSMPHLVQFDRLYVGLGLAPLCHGVTIQEHIMANKELPERKERRKKKEGSVARLISTS
jgi:hypothetical protein